MVWVISQTKTTKCLASNDPLPTNKWCKAPAVSGGGEALGQEMTSHSIHFTHTPPENERMSPKKGAYQKEMNHPNPTIKLRPCYEIDISWFQLSLTIKLQGTFLSLRGCTRPNRQASFLGNRLHKMDLIFFGLLHGYLVDRLTPDIYWCLLSIYIYTIIYHIYCIISWDAPWCSHSRTSDYQEDYILFIGHHWPLESLVGGSITNHIMYFLLHNFG